MYAGADGVGSAGLQRSASHAERAERMPRFTSWCLQRFARLLGSAASELDACSEHW